VTSAAARASAPAPRAEPAATILIVDDEPANRALVRAYFDSRYRLREAADGAQALEIVKSAPVDLVLLDVMMPHLSGIDVCQRIKQGNGDRPYLPVILLTALDAQEDRNRGLQAGADDFLTKPVDRHELLLRVQTFIRLRQQDQRIRQQLDELNRRDEVIRTQVEELRALGALKDDLVSLMVHDLRNPLTGIVGFLEVIQTKAEDPELRDDAQMAMEAGAHLKEILDDMLHIRVLESGAVQIHRELVEVDALVKDAITSICGAARARHVEISQVMDPLDSYIVADRKLVRRAIENLLTNALRYSPSGAIVQAAVRRIEDDVEIEIADRGEGIPDHLKALLFQKFGSIEASLGKSRLGVGLGLYLVRLVANAHGGRAVVRNRVGGGTSFALLLPRQAAPAIV
jgi:two-component system sensor histidine kinase/response regulator